MRDQAVPGHNRWHPDIPPAVTCKPGTVFRVECREWTDGQIGNDDSANDVRDVDLSTRAHALRPDLRRGRRARRPAGRRHPRPRAGARRRSVPSPARAGATPGSSPRRTAAASSPTSSPTPTRRSGTSPGRSATSRHIPGVEFTGIIHPGPVRAPRRQPDLLARWNAREQALIDTDPDRVPPLALPPLPDIAVLGARPPATTLARAAADGARTVPARENGGNQDIKNLSKGSRVFYPVFVDGRKLSGRRPALLPGRRRDHLLRRDRDGRLHRLPRRPHQGRHGDLRRHDQPDLHAGQRRAALLGVRHVHRHRASTTRPTRSSTSTRRSPTATPA